MVKLKIPKLIIFNHECMFSASFPNFNTQKSYTYKATLLNPNPLKNKDSYLFL